MHAVCQVVPSNLTSFVHLKVLETPHHHQYYIQDTFMSFAIKKKSSRCQLQREMIECISQNRLYVLRKCSLDLHVTVVMFCIKSKLCRVS